MKKVLDKVNILADINNYFGEYRGRSGPIFIFLGLSILPCIIYAGGLWVFIPLKFFIFPELFLVLRLAMIILGNEKALKKRYLRQKNDEYSEGKHIIRLYNIYDNGLIEFRNGTVAFVVSGFLNTYFSEHKLSLAFEEFLDAIDDYEFDIYLHNVVNEDKLQDELEHMTVYKDKEAQKERIDFYLEQDKYSEENTTLFRFNILVKTYKPNWKVMSQAIENAVNSDASDVFKELMICNKEQVSDVMARDVCLYMNILQMLQESYENDNYEGSRVLYYGEEIPEEFQQKKEYVGLEERRVLYKDGGDLDD